MLVLADGTVLGETSYATELHVGDEISLAGRVTAEIPVERAQEFVTGAELTVLEVERVLES